MCNEERLKIGLALSGGGSRAIAFHLGCMRTLNDLGLLEKVEVLSTVSGGSVIGAMYAYSNCSFEEFDRRINKLLSAGLVHGVARYTMFSSETLKIVASLLVSGLPALLGRAIAAIVGLLGFAGVRMSLLTKLVGAVQVPIRRFASRTTAFEKFLEQSYFQGRRLSEVPRQNLNVVINAAELRTESAFRYGSKETGCWRYGVLNGSERVAKAVAASAAFPGFLPALDERYSFKKNGVANTHRVHVTDGGAYDNLGISCLVPGRNSKYSTNVYEVDFIIACVAGNGLADGKRTPYFWPSRMLATIETIHQRTHSMSFDLLHRLKKDGEIKGFLMPYLGQLDEKLPSIPPNLVRRSDTAEFPTNFSPMSVEDIRKLSTRGGQLTRILIEAYQPGLL